MPDSESTTSNRPETKTAVDPPPKQRVPANEHGLVIPELNSIFRALDLIAQRVVAELEKPPEEPVVPKNRRERLGQFAREQWKTFVQFAKDVGPFFTGVAGISASIVIAFVTVTVTISVAYFTYQFNKKQAEATSVSSKTAALADFGEDEKKRNVAAIKLASYGKDALPFIRVALGLDDKAMQDGALQTLEIIYKTQPESQTAVLTETAKFFKEGNPTLSFGVLKFYSMIAPDLDKEPKLEFIQQLKSRFGANAKSCANDTGDFVLEAVKFLGACPLSDVKGLLLDIAQNCPHQGTTSDYDGARIHAVNMLSNLIEKEPLLPKDERDAVVKTLHGLETDASGELKDNIADAIKQIEGSKQP